LLPELEGFVARGAFVFSAPVGLVHRVVSLESSRSDPTVFSHIRLAAMPLWVPFPAVALSYSIDLLWPDPDAQGPVRADNAGNVFTKIGRLIRTRAAEVFDRIGTPELFYRNCRAFLADQNVAHGYGETQGVVDPGLSEYLAGAAVLLGEVGEAVRLSNEFIEAFKGEENPYFVERVKGMQELARLAELDVRRARRLLREWDGERVANLGLGSFQAGDRWAGFDMGEGVESTQ